MKYLVIAITCILLTAASCKKNKKEEQLPPETQIGAFTFGCKVDGKIYTAKGKGGLLGTDHNYYSLRSADSSISFGAGTTSVSKNNFIFFFIIVRLKVT